MILGVAVFYIFNAIETQTAMMEVTQAKAAIINMMNGVLSGVSVFVSLVLGYLIVYASRFMLKKRKKGIWRSILPWVWGGSDWRLCCGWRPSGWGLISLGAGLLAGIGLSQLMSLAVSNLFQADVSRYGFVVSGQAVGKSILYFLLIYLVVMVFNTFSVSRARLVEFLTAGRKKEKNFLKNPILCGLVFLAASGASGDRLLQCDHESAGLVYGDGRSYPGVPGNPGDLSGVLVPVWLSYGSGGKIPEAVLPAAAFFCGGGIV